jgi:RHS repeat-associated protein
MLYNENGQVYQFDHDAANQLTAQTGLDGMRTEYTLDALGMPIEVKQAARTEDETIIALERDILGRLIAKTTPETVTRYTYDVAGQLVKIERHTNAQNEPNGKPGQPIDTLVYVYDVQGNLTEEHSIRYMLKGKPLKEPRTRILRHQHDALGNRTATELPQPRTLNYLYYGSGHLHQINLDGEVISDIERDAAHREIARSQGALLSRYQRDALGRRTAQRARFPDSDFWGSAANEETLDPLRMGKREGSVIAKGFAFDANGELTKRIDPLLGERDYAYDPLGRIASAHSPNHPKADQHAATRAETFVWDAASNLADPDRNQGKAPNNRVLLHGTCRYEYDALGRLITKRIGKNTVIRLCWNKENQLVESHSNRSGTGQTTTYEYDALGRRIAKHDAFGSTFFTWEGMRLLQEERGTSVATHLYEPGSYAPLARIDLQADLLAGARNPDEPPPVKANVYYFHTNVNGAPEEMTNGRGKVVWQARYAVWGNTVVEHWDRQHQPDSTGMSATHPLPQNLRMQGQYYDAETGLSYNTFRYYDSDIGRFVSQDPIGLAGGMNLYSYGPNPLSWVDPWGWTCWGTARKNYWKDEAKNNPSAYSSNNLNRMQDGLAPKINATVINNKTGAITTQDYSMELHHTNIPQRVGGTGVHSVNNLSSLTPWQHEAVDPYRNTGNTLVSINQNVGSW